MRHWFAHPELLAALALLPALGLLASLDARRRRRVLAAVGGVPALSEGGRLPRALRGLCLLLGLVALAAGAAGPRWGKDVSQPAPGRDLVVAVDCSRSMFAEAPSRFERARAALLDLADALRRAGGHRVALVAFAGRARVVCPLTHDYDHFREAAAGLDPQTFDADLGPAGDSPSGTRIGAGLREAVRAHDTGPPGTADVLLLSDGDDPARDGEWQAGAEVARARGMPVYVVGVGDPDAASVIPAEGGTLRHGGTEVRTKLEEAPLRAIAEKTGGAYFPAREKAVGLGALYLRAIASRPQRDDPDDALPVYRDRSAWFYGAGLALLAGSVLLGGLPVSRARGVVS
jgi:Ca-activated chloride channel family protein